MDTNITAATAAASSPAVPLSTCPHLSLYLSSHPQPLVTTTASALTSVAEWLDEAAASTLLTAIPTSLQPSTELQALIQYHSTLNTETQHQANAMHTAAAANTADAARTGRQTSRLQRFLPRCSSPSCTHPARPLMACLHCHSIGCWKEGENNTHTQHSQLSHSRAHAIEKKHQLGKQHIHTYTIQ